MKHLKHPTRILFFTGKGGVGKTTMACATAVQLADQGKRVLLVSTDPASNLHDVLATQIGNSPTPITNVPGLSAMNIDPAESARAYRERMIGPYRGVLPEAAVASMEEQLSGSCTLEIAAFDEFSRLLGDEASTTDFDHVIFDTAPTGHTLRLLTLPSAWSGFMETNTTGTSCLGPLAGLQDQQKIYQQSVAMLSDEKSTTLVLVTRPDASALKEAARTSRDLRQLGVDNQQLIVNGLFVATDKSDPLALTMETRFARVLNDMPDELADLPRSDVPLTAGNVLGIELLRMIGSDEAAITSTTEESQAVDSTLPGLESLLADLEAPGHGVILSMGKGGVGKTTVAASVAVALADRGHEVHLSTTDPAAHVMATLAAESMPHLTVSRIDPVQETADYTAEVMQTAGAGLDDAGRALLEEDLRSPCTEEIAVFRAFAQAVAEGTDRFVVLDTAPTGHTILLLDSALAYHREVSRQSMEMSESVQNLLPRLRDPEFTRVLIVTLPEATPVHEATQLQTDLRRAEIEPFAWVVNQSLTPLAVTDPVLKQRRAGEWPFITEIRDVQSQRSAVIPMLTEPPVGIDLLREMTSLQVSESGTNSN
ncbi:arsenical pump-driving ATPase [Thalassoglobus polymorphus]|uniref:arsenite-transporting ATPase n=1 Tax=Thalassoglobus polymorphus TaxID=2527994 RepID=A0A517QMZ8_9PLAN|nr:arsenical pump-driving ATPase [Thalassoglobus polymorphus]QDT33016.1 Arsenical pump-driving ATPase [Thalassoglobus polymorphus]